jgi:hypothetical protein
MTNTQAEPVHHPIHAVADRFAAQLLRSALGALANQRTLWPVTPQEQQQQVIDRLREEFADIIRVQMVDVAAAGFTNAEVTLGTLTAKGDIIKAQVNILDNKTLHQLVDRLGQKIVLVLVDSEVYAAGMESFEAQKDQPELPLEHVEPPASSPVRCTCAVQSYDPKAKHEPDCEYIAWYRNQPPTAE